MALVTPKSESLLRSLHLRRKFSPANWQIGASLSNAGLWQTAYQRRHRRIRGHCGLFGNCANSTFRTMTPVTGHRYALSKDLPRPVIATLFAVFSLTFVSFWLSWILDDTMHRWAHRSPATSRQYAYVVGGVTYYLSPHLGWYLDNSLWLHFAGLALCAVIPLLAGARWMRVR